MRIKGLDFLRGLAVLLVMMRHADTDNLLHDFGWLGVDLFFVLSGFLVSGLVFAEYKRRGKVDIGRFLLRRGFKIYPSFYFFILVSLAARYFYTYTLYDTPEILSEIFYLQSYFPGMWAHTWSLAVEEHFYLALSAFIFLGSRFRCLERKTMVIATLLALLVLSFLMRFYVSFPHRAEPYFPFIKTHLRMDGILLGILCSYLFQFTTFYRVFLTRQLVFGVIALLLLLPCFFYQGGSFFMNTWGLSFANISFAILLLFALKADHLRFRLPDLLFRWIGFIGIHSYSIYLWHLFAKRLVEILHPDPRIAFSLYIVLSLALGFIFSYLIERPFLRLRDVYVKKTVQSNLDSQTLATAEARS